MKRCYCGREATHTVSDGRVVLRVCYLHAHKAALSVRRAA